MTLFLFKDFYQACDHQLQAWKGTKLTSYTVYTDNRQKVGSIRDILVDDDGYFRYLVVEIRAWHQQKTILVPVGLAHLNYAQGHVFLENFTSSQLARLPHYHSPLDVDQAYEERVRDAFRANAASRAGHHFLQHPYTLHGSLEGQYMGSSSGYTPSSAQEYDHHPTFYGMSDQDNQQLLKQFENGLMACQMQVTRESK